MPNNNKNASSRGLRSASKETRRRVARAGGQAYHEKRGQHGSDSNTQSKGESSK
jgi:hypothetical protein